MLKDFDTLNEKINEVRKEINILSNISPRVEGSFDKLDKLRNRHSTLYQQRAELVLDIKHYIDSGFEKVCAVSDMWENSTWIYGNIKEDLMYSDHKSWVYLVVDGAEVVKVGETGLPLGIRTKSHGQPLANTNNRLGRLANFKNDNTDYRIRTALTESANNGKVSIWAKKCPIKIEKVTIGGIETELKTTYHKELELAIIDHMSEYGYAPRLNHCRK